MNKALNKDENAKLNLQNNKLRRENSMYIVFGFLMIGLVVYLMPLGRKGRKIQQQYWGTRKIELEDYDKEQKNIGKLMR